MAGPVEEIRIALTVDDFAAAMRFYRDTVGLTVDKEWHGPEGHGVIFTVPRGSLEVVDVADAASIDRAEVGAVTGEGVRMAMRVDAVDAVHATITAGGATPLGDPVDTPWGGRCARVRTPDGIQLTLFAHGGD